MTASGTTSGDTGLAMAQDIVVEIESGMVDEHLDLIRAAIARQARKVAVNKVTKAVNMSQGQVVARKNGKEIRIGDTVRFNGSVSPKYLQGRPATVVPRHMYARNTKKEGIVVSMPADKQAYRKFAGVTTFVPLSLITL